MTPPALNAASLWLVRLRDECVTPDDHAAFQAWLAEDPAHDEAFSLVSGAIGEMEALGPQLSGVSPIAGLRRERPLASRRGALAFGALAAALAVFAITGVSVLAPGAQTYSTRIG